MGHTTIRNTEITSPAKNLQCMTINMRILFI